MHCDERNKEDLSVRLNSYSAFIEPWKQNLIQSKSRWCKDCRTQYKDKTCNKVSIEAKNSKQQHPNSDYKQDVILLNKLCQDMTKQINNLPKTLKHMNLNVLELEKEELMNKSKKFTEALQGCFNDRTTYSNNCIFDRNTKLPSTDKGHSSVENDLQNSINSCKDVYDITSDNDKWKNRIKQLYGKKYPTDNVYDKPISPKRSKKRSIKKSKRSSRGKKSSIKKKGKHKGQIKSTRRMLVKGKK